MPKEWRTRNDKDEWWEGVRKTLNTTSQIGRHLDELFRSPDSSPIKNNRHLTRKGLHHNRNDASEPKLRYSEPSSSGPNANEPSKAGDSQYRFLLRSPEPTRSKKFGSNPGSAPEISHPLRGQPFHYDSPHAMEKSHSDHPIPLTLPFGPPASDFNPPTIFYTNEFKRRGESPRRLSAATSINFPSKKSSMGRSTDEEGLVVSPHTSSLLLRNEGTDPVGNTIGQKEEVVSFDKTNVRNKNNQRPKSMALVPNSQPPSDDCSNNVKSIEINRHLGALTNSQTLPRDWMSRMNAVTPPNHLVHNDEYYYDYLNGRKRFNEFPIHNSAQQTNSPEFNLDSAVAAEGILNCESIDNPRRITSVVDGGKEEKSRVGVRKCDKNFFLSSTYNHINTKHYQHRRSSQRLNTSSANIHEILHRPPSFSSVKRNQNTNLIISNELYGYLNDDQNTLSTTTNHHRRKQTIKANRPPSIHSEHFIQEEDSTEHYGTLPSSSDGSQHHSVNNNNYQLPSIDLVDRFSAEEYMVVSDDSLDSGHVGGCAAGNSSSATEEDQRDKPPNFASGTNGSASENPDGQPEYANLPNEQIDQTDHVYMNCPGTSGFGTGLAARDCTSSGYQSSTNSESATSTCADTNSAAAQGQINRSKAITFKRPQVPCTCCPPAAAVRNNQRHHTHLLDPEALIDQLYANIPKKTLRRDDKSQFQAANSTLTNKRNKLGLTIDISNDNFQSDPKTASTAYAIPIKSTHGGHRLQQTSNFNDDANNGYGNGNGKLRPGLPVYASLMNSPIFKNIKKLTYPKEEEESKRKRLLYVAIGVLIVVLILLILINVLLPQFIKQELQGIIASSNSHHTLQQNRTFGPSSNTAAYLSGFRKGSHYHKGHNSNHNIPILRRFPLENSPSPNAENPTAFVNLVTARPHSTIKLNSARMIFETAETSSSSVRPPKTTTTARPPSTWLPNYDKDIVCGQNQFSCPQGGVSRIPCLYEWERCDGIEDCDDASDEHYCKELNCYGNFQCASGDECLSISNVCNGIPECADGSDENDCEDWNCKPYEYQCSTGYCIPKEWTCDGDPDCPDHRDEFNCSSCSALFGTSCKSNEFLCPEGWCISSTWRCNGVPDCQNGSDELDCPTECDGNHFQCHTGGTCVSRIMLCDGLSDCPDGSDEFNCVRQVVDGDLIEILDPASDKWCSICGDSWNRNASDMFCRQLGFSSSAGFEFSDVRSNSNADDRSSTDWLYSFRPISLRDWQSRSIQSSLHRVPPTSCRTGIIRLQCVHQECGNFEIKSSPQVRQRRMVGGTVSKRSEWPAVGLLFHPGKVWGCTVTVLNADWLITSALCVQRTDPSPKKWRISLGTNQPGGEEDTSANQLIASVKRFVRHPSYKFKSFVADFDVMLIQLNGSLPPDIFHADTIKPVCLQSNPIEMTDCYTAGWGYTTPGGYFINRQLRHLKMDVEPQESCNSTEHYPGLISSSMICAWNPQQIQTSKEKPCFNDEGSPLMCKGGAHGQWTLQGVLSGHNCGSGRRQHPSVFTNPIALRRWISNIVGPAIFS